MAGPCSRRSREQSHAEHGEEQGLELSRRFGGAFPAAYMEDAFAEAGFAPVKSWTDPKEWYAVSLFRKN